MVLFVFVYLHQKVSQHKKRNNSTNKRRYEQKRSVKFPHRHLGQVLLEEPGGGWGGLKVGMHGRTAATHHRQAPSDLHHAAIPHHSRCQVSRVSRVI